jgi:DnaD/phage-associated family protein
MVFWLDEPLPAADNSAGSSVFALYEQNIRLFRTPLIAEELAEAEKHYPAEWIADAFREAVSLNRPNWRYIESILRRWEAEGRHERSLEEILKSSGLETPLPRRETEVGVGRRPEVAEEDQDICVRCGGAGFVESCRLGHPDFGKAFPCECTLDESKTLVRRD